MLRFNMSNYLTTQGRNGCLFLASLFLCYSAYGQHSINVLSEPFHKPVLQTEDLALIHLQMNKGDTSLFHSHKRPILYITIDGARMWLDELNGNSRTVNLPDGWIGSDTYSLKNPFVHRISVLDEGPLNLVAIIRKNESLKEDEYISDDFNLLENGFAVRKDSIPKSKTDGARINIILSGTATLDQNSLRPGDYFLPGQMPVNRSDNFQYCAVYF